MTIQSIGLNQGFGDIQMAQDGGGPSVSAPLGSVLASTAFDLDATIAASYTSGQTWSNYEGSPSTSDAQTDFDAWLGIDGDVDTDDPTLVGDAGAASTYFAHNGSTFNVMKTSTDLLTSMHKTTGGSDFWLAIAWQHVEGGQQFVFNTVDGTTNNEGLALGIGGNERFFLRQHHGSSPTVTASSTETLVGGVDYLSVITHSHSSDLTDYYINEASVESVAHAFGTTTTDATYEPLRMGTNGSINQQMHNGTRIYGRYGGNEYVGATKAGIIRTHLVARHGRGYITPP